MVAFVTCYDAWVNFSLLFSVTFDVCEFISEPCNAFLEKQGNLIVLTYCFESERSKETLPKSSETYGELCLKALAS